MPTLQIARSWCGGYRSRSFLLEYRTLALRGVLGLILPAILTLCVGGRGFAQELHVAAAADLQPVLPTLAAQYEQQTGVKIVSSFGSSATLAQQITNGAPVDVFLSADTVHPQQLVTAGLATDLTAYARGVLVLWARRDSPAQPVSVAALTSDKVQRLAIANELHAPYGLAAATALRALGVYDAVKPKLVVGENISQTAQFALTGNAQAGLISLTIASSPAYRDAGTFVVMPKVYGEMLQSGAVIAASKQQVAAKALVMWLASAAVQKQLPGFGLDAVK